jgi:hypothetical protein
MKNTNSSTKPDTSTLKKVIGIFAAVTLAFSLSACSGGSEKESTDTTATEQTTEETATEPTPMETRDTAPIVAGSIESVRVDDLSETCEAAIAPIREIMSKYKSGLLISQPDSEAISKAAQKAIEKDCTPEEFKKFEDQEFTGWNNAKTE